MKQTNMSAREELDRIIRFNLKIMSTPFGYAAKALSGGKYKPFGIMKTTPVINSSGVNVAGQVSRVGSNPDFRGQGLGKELYQEVARRQPGGRLFSDRDVTPAAQNVWRANHNGLLSVKDRTANIQGFNEARVRRIQTARPAPRWEAATGLGVPQPKFAGRFTGPLVPGQSAAQLPDLASMSPHRANRWRQWRQAFDKKVGYEVNQ